MNIKKIICFLALMTLAITPLFSQTTLVAELTGNPPDLTGWTPTNVYVEGEEIVLTKAQSDGTGAIFFTQAYDLNQCGKWKVEYDFRLYDGGYFWGADGLAFYYLENPPTTFDSGQSIGLPADSRGLKVIFDTYDNDYDNPNPELQVYYGEGYEETILSPNMLKAQIRKIRSDDYQHAEIIWDNGYITVKINGTEVLTGTPTSYDGVENITAGYFGFSAATGTVFDRQSIKNVQVYINAVELDNDVVQIEECDEYGDGSADFELTSVKDDIASPGTGIFSYYTSEDDANSATDPIPTEDLDSYTSNGETIYVRVENNSGCYNIAEIELIIRSIPLISEIAEIAGNCDADGNGSETYDLSGALPQIIANPVDYTISYYENQ